MENVIVALIVAAAAIIAMLKLRAQASGRGSCCAGKCKPRSAGDKSPDARDGAENGRG